MVRAEIDGIEPRAVACKLGSKDVMNLMHHGFPEVAAADTGLIRDENRLHATVVDPPDCRSGIAEWFIQAGIIHVSDFFGYRPVAVHEDGTIHTRSTNSRAASHTSSTLTPFMQR